ncbi:MAG: carbamoyltransferase C-terminal domain-containing protein [Desulfobacterales bacterium]|nr:carbamoyltransferase C-terminal domain-containing protein [Desulfobacterales bacterium]
MIVLGLSGALTHDPSAALFVDGRLVSAAEEERFLRDKHAKRCWPLHAARYCLDTGGVAAADVDAVAFPFAPFGWGYPGRWHFARRYWYAPDRALNALFNGNRLFRRNRRAILKLMRQLAIDPVRTPFWPVAHHLAHASSAYHLSGFSGKTAILGIDGKGEYATTFFGYGENGRIHTIREFYDPDSLGGVYGALTQYLGFEMLDGEFKVMGMAPYGDPGKYNFGRLISCDGRSFRVNTRLVNTVGLRRYKQDGLGFYFSPELIDWLGPKRVGDEIDDPYVDYAASMQALLEKVALKLIDSYLADVLAENGRMCFAGGVALNVKLNQQIIARPDVSELFVQPAASDAGTAIGAASYVAHEMGDDIHPLEHVYLGPSFTTDECRRACEIHADRPQYKAVADAPDEAARLLAAGHPVAWFQGRMEFGPRALGNRSILGDPSRVGMADRINAQIKYRERWRPFCPSILDRAAADILQTRHPAPYMTLAFDVADHWKARIPEVVHMDGTARAQVVTRETNPRYYALIEALEKHRGIPVVLNTSLNRRGEPIVCTPADALNMFYGSDLRYLFLEDLLVTK